MNKKRTLLLIFLVLLLLPGLLSVAFSGEKILYSKKGLKTKISYTAQMTAVVAEKDLQQIY